ncbi:MAG TPA: hypothetical protein VFZ40_06695 [Pyrinomonadaceae bacterium]
MNKPPTSDMLSGIRFDERQDAISCVWGNQRCRFKRNEIRFELFHFKEFALP